MPDSLWGPDLCLVSFKSSCLGLVARSHLNTIEAYEFKHFPMGLGLLTSTLLHCNIQKMPFAATGELENTAACLSTTFPVVEIALYPTVLLKMFSVMGKESMHFLCDIHLPIPSLPLFIFLLPFR